ncbi:MAG: hypothetical protein RIS47_643 [Bacteroidota bacterium]
MVAVLKKKIGSGFSKSMLKYGAKIGWMVAWF